MLFLDMDGVIAIHEPEAYVESEGKEPLFFKRGYFASLFPDAFIQRLIHMLKLNNVEFAILSTVVPTDCDPGAFIPIGDKIAWLKQHFQGFDAIKQERTLFSVKGKNTKAEVAQKYLGRPLTLSDILIDDFNAELQSWEESGGTAVKYINGANNYNSWAGLSIAKPLSPEEMARYDVDFLMKIESDATAKLKTLACKSV